MNRIINGLQSRFKNDRAFSIFFCSGVFAGFASGVQSTIFANFLYVVYKISVTGRGALEFPRELPGFLTIFILAALAAFTDARKASIALLMSALGFFGIALLSPGYGLLVVWIVVQSFGQHMLMPTNAAIGMNLSRKEEFGRRLGLFSAGGLFATIFAQVFVLIGFSFLGLSFGVAFMISAVFYAVAAGAVFLIRKEKALQHEKDESGNRAKRSVRFVVKKEFTLYYLLSFFNGGRKQVFLTFAPWVLISNYGYGPEHFAILAIIVSVASIITRTAVGRAIDKLGERAVLSAEALMLVVICFGYIFSGVLFSHGAAGIIMAACYVLDSSTSVVEMARSTYVRKVSPRPEYVTPTLSLGLCVDHSISMTIPVLGGMLWAAADPVNGYRYVFACAAVIGLINFLLATNIKTPDKIAESAE